MYPDHQNRSDVFKDDIFNVKAGYATVERLEYTSARVGLYTHPGKVEYLAMPSEDLLDPDKRNECLQRLAQFVGSTVNNQTLCCLGRGEAKDFGQSQHYDPPRGNLIAEADQSESSRRPPKEV
jgi:hypothetical protein